MEYLEARPEENSSNVSKLNELVAMQHGRDRLVKQPQAIGKAYFFDTNQLSTVVNNSSSTAYMRVSHVAPKHLGNHYPNAPLSKSQTRCVQLQ